MYETANMYFLDKRFDCLLNSVLKWSTQAGIKNEGFSTLV